MLFFKSLEDVSSYHVMGFAECRFGDAVDDNIVTIRGYISIGQYRNTQGGGVVLYINNNLRAKVLARSNATQNDTQTCFEYTMCYISGKKTLPIFVCSIYRPTYAPFDDDPQYLPNIRELSSNNSHKIIMGDLNLLTTAILLL